MIYLDLALQKRDNSLNCRLRLMIDARAVVGSNISVGVAKACNRWSCKWGELRFGGNGRGFTNFHQVLNMKLMKCKTLNGTDQQRFA